MLFCNAAALREKATRSLYESAGQPPTLELKDAEIVQAFIDAEHSETTFHPRYHGFYNQRFLSPVDLDRVTRETATEFADEEKLSAAESELYDAELQSRMEARAALQKEGRFLSQVRAGTVRLVGKSFEFRGARHKLTDVNRLLEQLREEMDRDQTWFEQRDERVAHVYHAIARKVGDEARTEFEERYRFQLALQPIAESLVASHSQACAALNLIAGQRQLTEMEFHGTVSAVQMAYDDLNCGLQSAAQLRIPPLKNMTAGQPLDQYLLSQPLIPRLSGDDNCLQGNWIGCFLQQFAEVLDKAHRLCRKNLGGILAFHEKLNANWSSRRSNDSVAAMIDAPPPTDVTTHTSTRE